MKRDVTKDEALRRAAAYCSRSEHCTGEVRAKLMQWGLAAGDADSVVADLAAQGFVDDRRYARAFVHDKSRLTGWGRTKIAFHLRAKMIDKYDLPSFEFSQNYCSFYDLLEKSNLFLQAIIDTRDKPMEDRTVTWLFQHPIGDGGQFTGVSNLIMKYGVVPKAAMPETYQSNNTGQMTMILSLKLREFGLELRCMKE